MLEDRKEDLFCVKTFRVHDSNKNKNIKIKIKNYFIYPLIRAARPQQMSTQ